MKLRALPLSMSLSLFTSLVVSGSVLAQTSPGVRLEAQSIRVDEKPRSVTVYQGRAAVIRSVRRLLGPGTYEFVFTGLPESVQPESLQAHANGPARVIGAEYVERAARDAAVPRLAELDAAIARIADDIARRLEDRELINARRADLDAISAHASKTVGAVGGSDAIDLDAVGDQLAFFASARRKLLTERRDVDALVRELEENRRVLESERESLAGASRAARTAIVTVAVEGGTEIAVELIYLVTNANWTPAYNVRASGDGTRVDIEYDALIEQRTGEDWNDVELIVSTAQPARAADPPSITPWVVDVREPEAEAPAAVTATAMDAPWRKSQEHDATIRGAGPAVTYTIARPVSVPTDARRRQRARITNVVCRPTFTHVAIPLLTESVYVRSDLTNASDYQLLPGSVAIFVGADYVGPTTLRSIAPHEAFEVYFGIDRAVTATRKLISRQDAKTGLLGGGRKTSYDYRIELENGAGKDLRLDLWDRMPVSRSDRVQVQLVGLTHDLSADGTYFEEDFSRGLLKWELTIPAFSQDANATVVEFGVRIVRAKEVDVTGLPE